MRENSNFNYGFNNIIYCFFKNPRDYHVKVAKYQIFNAPNFLISNCLASLPGQYASYAVIGQVEIKR